MNGYVYMPILTEACSWSLSFGFPKNAMLMCISHAHTEMGQNGQIHAVWDVHSARCRIFQKRKYHVKEKLKQSQEKC